MKKITKKKVVKKVSSETELKNFKHNVHCLVHEIQSELEQARELLYSKTLTVEKIQKASIPLSNITEMLCDYFEAYHAKTLCKKKSFPKKT